MNLCSIPGCTRPMKARGWCGTHWWRWRNNGDPMALAKRASAESRFWEKVDKTETCWLWTGSKSKGYGTFNKGDGTYTYAHRFAYELEHGPVPPKRHLHHKCETPACVRPSHLFAVTPATHHVAHRARFCKRGHEFTEENTYYRRDNGNGIRQCRECIRLRSRGGHKVSA